MEIGAFDGDAVSNTCLLADLGWDGLYVEAVPEYTLSCLRRHIANKVKVMHCAVTGSYHGFIDISVGVMLSSARMDHVETFESLDWSRGHHKGDIRKVPAISVETLLKRFVRRKRIDLAVVDVEGMEPEIFSGWSFDLCRPSLIIVESRDKSSGFGAQIRAEYQKMLKQIVLNGYHIIQHDGCNVVLKSCV